jgi:hypothetical protein
MASIRTTLRNDHAKNADFPFIDETLLQELERIFPDKCPDGGLSNDDIRERIGETRVLRYLRRQFERQSRSKMEQIL